MNSLTAENITTCGFDEMREFVFALVKPHDTSVALDRELFVRLLGEYASVYQYLSELYTFMIGRVREAGELGKENAFRKAKLMDKRDCLEWALKACKFQYDSLSRKVTILCMEDSE